MKLATIVLKNEKKYSSECGRHDPYTFAYVYAEETAFLVKGYLGEVKAFLKGMQIKALVNVRYYNKGEYRGYWRLYHNGETIPRVYIDEPTLEYARRHYPGKENTKWIRKYTIWAFSRTNDDVEPLILKRLPKKWIPEFDRFIPKERIIPQTHNRNRVW